ncbi:hypothetical protein HDU67_003832 [Dinochytrium kinnereticum]|nr:hypothetical protein HDU67_003832 [Dinochytrium kinnereticum]
MSQPGDTSRPVTLMRKCNGTNRVPDDSFKSTAVNHMASALQPRSTPLPSFGQPEPLLICHSRSPNIVQSASAISPSADKTESLSVEESSTEPHIQSVYEALARQPRNQDSMESVTRIRTPDTPSTPTKVLQRRKKSVTIQFEDGSFGVPGTFDTFESFANDDFKPFPREMPATTETTLSMVARQIRDIHVMRGMDSTESVLEDAFRRRGSTIDKRDESFQCRAIGSGSKKAINGDRFFSKLRDSDSDEDSISSSSTLVRSTTAERKMTSIQKTAYYTKDVKVAIERLSETTTIACIESSKTHQIQSEVQQLQHLAAVSESTEIVTTRPRPSQQIVQVAKRLFRRVQRAVISTRGDHRPPLHPSSF